MYIDKYQNERSSINTYGRRFFDASDPEEYRDWLAFQEYREKTEDIGSLITTVKEDKELSLDNVNTEYVCLQGSGVSFYDAFEAYAGLCREYDVLYFDHDHQDENGNRHDPVMKPDFSYDTLRGFNYIGNCAVVKTELLKKFDGEAWDIYRWLLELSDEEIRFGHVSKVLYRDTAKETDESETVKEYLEDHDIKADVTVCKDSSAHIVSYAVQGNPKVSLIIPTRDGMDVLKVCIDSIYEKTTYGNYEIVIADNGSKEPETLQYFEQLQKDHDNIKVVRIDGPFNFSYINNKAVEQANGYYIVLLNNDTSVVTPDWLEKMLGYAQRDNVGSVGTMLWYPDGTVQHGGVIVGKGGAAAHRYYRCEHEKKGYMHTLDVPNDVICCTAACLMTSRKCWEEAGGLNEDLTVQFNDVDYGLRLYEKGYFNVFMPNVELIHYESKSRGIDKKRSAVKRFFSEVNWFQKTYGKYIAHDPFYNDNFDKSYDYKLKAGPGSK